MDNICFLEVRHFANFLAIQLWVVQWRGNPSNVFSPKQRWQLKSPQPDAGFFYALFAYDDDTNRGKHRQARS